MRGAGRVGRAGDDAQDGALQRRALEPPAPHQLQVAAESTLARTVEPGSNTPSCVSSSGRRLGIWMGLTDDLATPLRAAGVPQQLGARLRAAPPGL